jgi:hypothetical protein
MKNFIHIILASFTLLFLSVQTNGQDITQLVGQCAANAGDVTYLKDFVVKLDAATPGGKPPVARYSMVLSKNTMYRFSICTSPSSDGEAFLQLFDMNMLLGSTYISATGKDFPYFDFKCQKTGVYNIFISFKEGRAGEAVGILSFVKQL